MKCKFCRRYARYGRSAGIVKHGRAGHFCGDTHEKFAFHTINGDRGSFKSDNGVNGIVPDKAVREVLDLVAKLLGVKLVCALEPIEGCGIYLEMADAVKNANIVAVIVTVDYHKHAVWALFVRGTEYLKALLAVLDAVGTLEASVTDEYAGIRRLINGLS